MNKVLVNLANHEMVSLRALGEYRGDSNEAENLKYCLSFTTNALANSMEDCNGWEIKPYEPLPSDVDKMIITIDIVDPKGQKIAYRNAFPIVLKAYSQAWKEEVAFMIERMSTFLYEKAVEIVESKEEE